MKNLLLIVFVAIGVCYAAVDRRGSASDEEEDIDRRELMHEIDDLERDVRSFKNRKTLLTQNVALLPAIPHLNERRSALPSVIDQLDADFVCIQEAWYLQDVNTILNHAKDEFPYTYSLAHTSLSQFDTSLAQEAPCDNMTQFQAAMGCTLQKCLPQGLAGLQLLACAKEHCGLMEMRQECITCVVTTAGDMAHIQGCATPHYSIDQLGLLVLSKYEPKSYEVNFFESQDIKKFLPRGYIQFEFDDLKRVVCTHLTAEMEIYFEPFDYGSSQKQQEAEINKLIDLLKTDDDLILMGDFNTGPAVPEKNIQVEVPDNYQIFKDSKFKSPFEDEVNECTWCGDNPLINVDKSHEIDFILLHGRMKANNVARVYDENLPNLGFPLSDHYGVRMDVWRKPLSWWERFLKKLRNAKSWACKWLPWCKKRSLGNEEIDDEFEEEQISHLF